jgi:hypothetical protein
MTLLPEPHCRNPIFKLTRGVPRSINRLCDRALRVCMAEKLLKVNRKLLKQAAAALSSGARFSSGSRAGRSAFFLNTIRRPMLRLTPIRDCKFRRNLAASEFAGHEADPVDRSA